MHARVLRDFFYYWEFKNDKTKRQKPDDVIAEDYVSDWTSHCPPIGHYLRDNKERLASMPAEVLDRAQQVPSALGFRPLWGQPPTSAKAARKPRQAAPDLFARGPEPAA